MIIVFTLRTLVLTDALDTNTMPWFTLFLPDSLRPGPSHQVLLIA